MIEKPPEYDEPKDAWVRIESKTVEGEYYYYNGETGESSVDAPPGFRNTKSQVEIGKRGGEQIFWKRVESKTKPGNFYYFNPNTGVNELQPPQVDPPWQLTESKTKKGQYYYFNDDTGENVVDPPPCARPSKEKASKSMENGSGKGDEVPAPWVKKQSDTHKGKVYYVNSKTGETSWQHPSVWVKKESTSNPGIFYYVNKLTGETSWESAVKNDK